MRSLPIYPPISTPKTCRFGRPRARRWLAAGGLALLLTGVAEAQGADDSLDRAALLMRQRDPLAAYALLADQEMARAGEPQFDYLLGVAALDSGHVTRAIFALERLTAIRPDDQPARAELARAYLAAGETENARRELVAVRSADVPAEATAAIDRVLGALDQVAPAAGPKVFSYLEIGAGYDSNVNSATNAGQFAVPAFGGLLFSFDPGSRRQRDLFGSLAAGTSVQWGLDAAWSVLAAVNGRGTVNRHDHEMNTSLLDGTLGLSHSAGANVQTLAVQSNAAWVSSSVYRTANGASAQWQRQLDPASQVSAFAQWSRQEYSGQAERNTDRSVVGAAGAHSFDATDTLAYASAYLADERARADGFKYHGHRAVGLRLGGEQRLAGDTVGFVEWQHERRNYGGTEPLFDYRRRDRQDDVIAGVRYTPAAHWQVVPQIHGTRAASTVSLFDYRRTVVQIVLRREFE